MKLCTFSVDSVSARTGMVIGDYVFDLAESLRETEPQVDSTRYQSMLEILRSGPDGFVAVRRLEELLHRAPTNEQLLQHRRAIDSVRLLAPVPRPNSLRDFLVFEQHLINSTHAVAKRLYPPVAWLNGIARRMTGKSLLRPPKVWYEIPIYYKGNPDTVVGPESLVSWPNYSNELDYELEFGIYLWKTGKDIAKRDAAAHVAGFTIFNDFSARDVQFREMAGRLGPTKGKDFDTGNVMGPFLVTPDEVRDAYALEMRAYVNDELWSQGNSRDMHFSFEEMIAYVSRAETLHPGDFFGSGTVGTGCGLELGRQLKLGDRVTLEVERLGRLSNPIGRASSCPPAEQPQVTPS